MKSYPHKGSGDFKILQLKGIRNNDPASSQRGHRKRNARLGISGQHLSRDSRWRLLVSARDQTRGSYGANQLGRRLAQIRALALRLRAATSTLHHELRVRALQTAVAVCARRAVSFRRGWKRDLSLCQCCRRWTHRSELTVIKKLDLCLYCVERRNQWLEKYCARMPIAFSVAPYLKDASSRPYSSPVAKRARRRFN